MVKENSVTRLISKEGEIFIDHCDGTKTIASSEDVFDLCIGGNCLKEDFNIISKSTKKIQVSVSEVIKNSTLVHIFGCLDKNHDLDELCLTQHQISDFCRDHRDLLRGDTYGTLFLTKTGVNYYVLHVIMLGGGLAIHRHHLGDSTIHWKSACLHRVIVRSYHH